MFKVVGAVMVITACALWGSLKAGELREHDALLLALLSALETMRAEITSRLTPMPEIAERLARTGPEQTRPFFSLLDGRLCELGDREFSEIWSECVSALYLPRDEEGVLRDLGRVLGRYGPAEQGAALELCMEALSAAQKEAHAEARSGSRLWTGVSLTAGMLLAVMLI